MFTSDGDGVVSNIVYSGNDVTLCDMREISPLLLMRTSQLFVWVAGKTPPADVLYDGIIALSNICVASVIPVIIRTLY
jgi:hypothetical protein